MTRCCCWILVILIFPGEKDRVPIYFRILQHFDIITSSFLGISLAKSELNSNCLHRDQRRSGVVLDMLHHQIRSKMNVASSSKIGISLFKSILWRNDTTDWGIWLTQWYITDMDRNANDNAQYSISFLKFRRFYPQLIHSWTEWRVGGGSSYKPGGWGGAKVLIPIWNSQTLTHIAIILQYFNFQLQIFRIAKISLV